ncbi:iron ABC transporter ATP-binding protein [Sulfitobacter donghicola]|uniref:ABC transporter ATP-binding protein n=1 Tax=Sulfitobacter donghicola DSW-25 = KCTC 12864 = JCM 14565 TaxID=1300350 RepID=A0A073IDS4_9RHOB|nr:ATP-binding cassette domain-containing protein [Sulfitobacter donghicola]KEJ88498.1 ABC transporter ATP-binding protein [Sulfitobacter donghicola DSW-25 = KCTC 12864 = JCM 14565]KIN69626.1 Iron(III) dicitrate transport ATP-binding protein FecE [Sulfitobacter donghicola DSW-25 = KCTC 12864 = JCM 14565]
MINVSDVSYRIGKTTILDQVDLNLPKGGVTALIGPNGAGKSTLLSLIARILPLQDGTIEVDDLMVGACANDVLARKLSILPQASDAAPLLTVRELVSFGRYPYHNGRPSAKDAALVEQAIETFGLTGLASRRLDSLSGGQRQRAQVAMIYAQDTDYILLDEPLNNLDIAASRSLMKTLQELAQTHGRTIVIVLHDINYAAAYADRIIAMKQGTVVAVGHPNEVITAALLKDVFETDPKLHTLNGKVIIEV